MEQPVLGNKDQYPIQEIIFDHIGPAKPLWQQLFAHIHAQHPEMAEEWRYYNDGKSWLLKATAKGKTIFWLSIAKDVFRTTFYLSDKAEPLIMGSKLPEELKEHYRQRDKTKKLFGMTITYKTVKDVENAGILIEIKLKLK